MEYSAIFHDMDKRFCYAIDKDLFVIRVQVKKDDLAGDRVGGKPVALFGGPGRQCQHRHGAAEDAQQQIDLIRSFKILSNAFQ